MNPYEPNINKASTILGYCTNVHPGVTLKETLRQLATYPHSIQKMTHLSESFGVGIWLSSEAAHELLKNNLEGELLKLTKEVPCKLYSLNGFPFSDFHSDPVKEQVYLPDWSDSRRLEYTLDLIKISKQICDTEKEFSISTLPVAQRSITFETERLISATENIVKAALELSKVEIQENKKINLSLEPEPLCFLESSTDVIHYFLNYLIPIGTYHFQKELGFNYQKARQTLLDKVRICHDICHSAVAFEDFKTTLKSYDSLGIKIGKIQISSALEIKVTNGKFRSDFSDHNEIKKVLEELSTDRYLHQVVGNFNHQNIAISDLPEALSFWRNSVGSGTFRVHYHVPVFLREFMGIRTTQGQISEVLEVLGNRAMNYALEIETYTWNSLQNKLNESDLSAGIAKELNWVHEQISQEPILNEK